jgi:hypothetical protein
MALWGWGDQGVADLYMERLVGIDTEELIKLEGQSRPRPTS